MATVEISSQLNTEICQRMIFGNPGAQYSSGLTSLVESRMTYMLPLLPQNYYTANVNNESYQFKGTIDICKGTVPTDFSTLTAYNSRSADVLITVKSHYPDQKFASASTIVGNLISLSSSFATATQTGTATWFILRSYSTGVSGLFSLYHQIVGTVGATGSGSDLEISSTNLVSGNAYRITNLRFQIPASYTY